MVMLVALAFVSIEQLNVLDELKITSSPDPGTPLGVQLPAVFHVLFDPAVHVFVAPWETPVPSMKNAAVKTAPNIIFLMNECVMVLLL
jgi:hypothetical protein